MKRPFFVIAAGFVLGEVFALQMKMAGMADTGFCEKIWSPSAVTALMGILTALGAVSALAVCSPRQISWIQTGRGMKKLLPVCIFTGSVLICSLLGFARAGQIALELDRQEEWVFEHSGTVVVQGKLERLESDENGWELWITDVREGQGQKGPEKLLVRMKELTDREREGLCIGMNVAVTGTLKPLERAGNPGEFDYRLYSLSRGITGQIWGQKLQILDQRTAPYEKLLFSFRKKWSALLGTICPPKEAGLFRSVLLGEKKSLDSQLRELYQQSGIAHLLAISGLHLSILGMGLYRGLRKAGAPIGIGAALSCMAVLGYGEMIGAVGSGKRAIIMMVIAFFAELCRRTYDPLTALGLAAVWITWDFPYQLLQSGFQLSFGAVLGICMMNPSSLSQKAANQKAAKKKASNQKASSQKTLIQNGLALSLTVQAAILPIAAYHFFRIPIYGVLLNIIVVPLMAYALYSGIGGICLGSVCAAAGAAALWPGSRIFELYEILSRWVSSLPGSSFLVGRPDGETIFLYYGCLLTGRYLAGQNKRGVWAVLTAAVLTGPFLLKPQPPDGLTVTVLDVGQGDGIVLQTASDVVLIDGGSSDNPSLGSYILTPFLESRAVEEIDYAIVSHGDQDHISGLKTLLEEQTIDVRHLLLPAHGKGQEVYNELDKLAKAQNGSVFYVGQGDRLTGQETGLTLTCLYPQPPDKGQKIIEEKNDHSLVMLAEYQAFSMILTGDLGEEGELAMMSQRKLQEVTVLKVGHHGSRESTCQAFLETIRPSLAVISCGKQNSYGHPHNETIERIKKLRTDIWITSEQGAIELQTDGERMEIAGFCPPSDME